MNEEAVKAFLQQFAASRKEFDDWPPWMKESAKVASASFPKVQRRTEAASSDVKHPVDEPKLK